MKPNSVIDGICDDGAGNCTLRAAIQEADATVAPDSIGFAITPLNGTVKTIAPASPLPDILIRSVLTVTRSSVRA